MPYIKKEDRENIDVVLEEFINKISSLPEEEQDGAINYSVTKLLKNVYPEKYFHYNRALGVFESIKQEFYRTTVAPYEEKKREENGDV